MKWSEQMRVLNSEDEHYNQLLYDMDESKLYLNKKLIAVLKPHILENSEGQQYDINALFYDDTIEIIKKYPFFTDINFLLNCIITVNKTDGIQYSKTLGVTDEITNEGRWIIINAREQMIGIQPEPSIR